MRADFESITNALVSGFGALKLFGRSVTVFEHATALAKSNLPSLEMGEGPFTTSDEHPFSHRVQWTIPMTLRVPSEAGKKARTLRLALPLLMQRAYQMRGLPVDAAGVCAPADTLEHERRIETGELTLLADRRGPTITRVEPVASDGSYAEVKLTVALEFILDLDWREERYATVAVLRDRGVNPNPFGTPWTEPLATDYHGYGQVGPDSVVGLDDAGPSADDASEMAVLPRSLQVSPASASVAAMATTTLTAIVTYQDFATAIVPATWQSSNEAVATVSASGVVTGVSAGTATITATAVGLTATASITVT